MKRRMSPYCSLASSSPEQPTAQTLHDVILGYYARFDTIKRRKSPEEQGQTIIRGQI